jgi:hypothetical protein
MLDVGVAERGLDGGVSGDLAVVTPAGTGTLLVAIDGLGHGPAAAEASAAAARLIEQRPADPLDELFARCHEALRRTRGAVMTAARVTADGSLEWVGIGNVEARVLRSGVAAARQGTESPVLFGGVLGHQARRVRPSRVALGRGDVLVLATDGLRGDFATGVSVQGSAQTIADRILAASSRGHDDALVLVARFLGPGE